jgi:hypothetical protein
VNLRHINFMNKLFMNEPLFNFFRMSQSKPFAVVHFLADDAVEPVPRSWLADNDNFVLWPVMYTDTALRKARLSCADPDPKTWTKYAVRKLGDSCK